MPRATIAVALAALLISMVSPALAQLTIVQSWPPGTFPGGIAYDADRDPAPMNLWICDEAQPEQVAEVTRDGVFVSGFSVDADVQDAVGLTLSMTDGNLYITDDNASDVIVYTTMLLPSGVRELHGLAVGNHAGRVGNQRRGEFGLFDLESAGSRSYAFPGRGRGFGAHKYPWPGDRLGR